MPISPYDGYTAGSNWIRANQPVVVTNIAALRALDKTKIGYAVTKGYWLAGDGGAGEYWYDSSDTSSIDNGGTVIKASDNGRWKLIVTGPTSVKVFGAKGDGVADDTVALKAALLYSDHVYLNSGVYLISETLTVRAGSKFVGAGCGEYDQQGATTRVVSELRIKANTATRGVNLGSKAHMEQILVRPEGFDAVPFYLADYPSGTGNASEGVYVGYDTGTGAGSSSISHVTVQGFSQSGLILGVTSRVAFCNAYCCNNGYTAVGTDGWLVNSVAMFCHTTGVDIQGQYWNISGNRFEWNARYGVLSGGGEATITGNIFDRNGWAGLSLKSGAWGQVVSGNYFSRNGAGGDGTVGRWGFSSPSHPSYVATEKNASCHISIDYQRSVTITGNRFRAGGDDANQGVSGPCYNYSSLSSSDSTKGKDCVVVGNVGDSYYESILGYSPSLYSNSGAPVGGSDSRLVEYLTAILSNKDPKVSRAVWADYQAGTATLDILVPVSTSGEVLLRSAIFNQAGLSKVYFWTNAVNTGMGTSITNINASLVSSAVLTSVDDKNNKLSLTLATSSYCSHHVTIV